MKEAYYIINQYPGKKRPYRWQLNMPSATIYGEYWYKSKRNAIKGCKKWAKAHGILAMSTETIKDGFGSEWNITCPMCGRDSMQIVRPGKVQCGHCG